MNAGSTITPRAHPVSAAVVGQVGALQLPTKRDEAWRYAPHAALAQLSFGPASSSVPAVSAEVEQRIPALGGPTVVIVNGVIDQARSNLSDLPTGLGVTTLAEATANDASTLDRHFGADTGDAFEAFNIAFGNDGAVISVGEGHELDTPIHIVDISIAGETPNASCAGVVIDLAAASSATVVETHIGAGDTGGSNTRTTVTLATGATLEHIVLQDLPSAQIQLSAVAVTQAAGSEFHGRSFNLGGSFGRLAYHVEMVGDGAHADLSGLFFGRGDQTLDQQITVVHGAKDCTSRQSYRGVLDDDSVGVFNGGIDVRPGADGTDAVQSNANLLLSNRAEINTQPRLEILADDVACKHGATVGQLDEEALYYLRSRGIPAEESRRLLINGFADQTVEEVGNDTIRAWVIERLGHDDE